MVTKADTITILTQHGCTPCDVALFIRARGDLPAYDERAVWAWLGFWS